MILDPDRVATAAVAGVACLTPLGVYLVWLAAVNRRGHPVPAAAGWDFIALVAGLGGFVLLGGLLLLAFAQSNVRHLFAGDLEGLRVAWQAERAVWTVIATGYLLAVAGAVAAGFIARTRTLAVYNFDADRAAAVVDEVLAEVGVPARRFGNVWSAGPPVVAVEEFPTLRHVSVRILTSEPQLVAEIDRGLRRRIAALTVPPNPVARWFGLGAFACLVFLSGSVLLSTVYFLAARH